MSSVAEKIAALKAIGAELWVEGDEVKLRYPPSRTKRVKPLLDELRQQRQAVLEIVQQTCVSHTGAPEKQIWPRRCLEVAERFDRPYMRLYPLIGKKVSTPSGPGKLEQVLGPKLVRVVLDCNPTRMTTFDWEQILPLVV